MDSTPVFKTHSTLNQLKWSQSVIESLRHMGIGGGDINEFVDKTAMQRMTDILHQEAFAEINRDGSKLRTYAKLKQEPGIETYLNTITNVDRRIHLCKIRLSNHELMIEKGRHQGLEIKDRNCPFCPENLLEDELHFLLTCDTYSLLSEELFAETEHLSPRFKSFSKEQQMKILLQQENIVNFCGIYIQKAVELRRFILDKHKNVI